MKFRSVIYWGVSLVVATYASGLTVASAQNADPSLVSASISSLAAGAAIPEFARSILLFIGILAVAFTYHRAWANFRGTSSCEKLTP